MALGFVVGMGHALEADHLAAVGAMASGRRSPKQLAILGMVWGVGHTITLFAICSAVIFFGFVLTERAAAGLEFGIGIMLVVLGLDVLRRLKQARIHFHVHDHGDGPAHIHAHSHMLSDVPHTQDPHKHKHQQGFPLKPLVVGLAHGAAGSAGLLALSLAVTRDPWIAAGYVALFGIGSIAGMAALTCVAAWPLNFAEHSAQWLHRGLYVGIGLIAIGLGIGLMIETGQFLWGSA